MEIKIITSQISMFFKK